MLAQVLCGACLVGTLVVTGCPQQNPCIPNSNQNICTSIENNVVKVSKIDKTYLKKLASYYGGSSNQQAYNILVTLNKCASSGQCVQDVVLNELCNKQGLSKSQVKKIKITNSKTKKAINNALSENCNISCNSLKYKVK